MIYFPKSRYQVSQEFPVVSGQLIVAEGSALIASTIAGAFGVQPCSNAAANFMGFAVAEQLSLASLPKVERFSITGGIATTVVLSRTPSASSLFAFNVTTNTALALTTDWTLVSDTVTWVTDQSGNDIDFFYRYAPSVAEAQAIQGDVKPGGAAGLLLNQVGLIERGVIYTTEFDTSVNWLATDPIVKLGASGRVTIGGSGSTIKAVVVAAPNSGGPDGGFLGLEFTADV